MNRPHIAALLRNIAEYTEACGWATHVPEPDIKAEVDRLISDMVSRLRQRADEIEGPLHGPL